MESTENWLPVVGYEGVYEVSDLGRVRTVKRKVQTTDGRRRTVPARIRKGSVKASGHVKVSLWRDNRETTAHVHTLVAEAFIGPRPEGMYACHNNGDPTDNRVGNIRWGSPSSNSYDKRAHGTDHKVNRTHCPRGHELVQPNLEPAKSRMGHRSCRACSRERARAHDKREPFDIAKSDWQYERIMNAAA